MPPTRHISMVMAVDYTCGYGYVQVWQWLGLWVRKYSIFSLSLSFTLPLYRFSLWLSLSLSLSRALPLSMWGELGSPRANVGMGIRSSCVGWVHPGSALTWVGGELGSQDQRHEPRGEIKYVKRYDPVELKVCVVDVPNALRQVMSIWIWLSTTTFLSRHC